MLADAATVAKVVLGKRAADWKSLLPSWQRRGFPQPDPVSGLYYLKAVEAWFDRQYGLSQVPVLKPDGKEDPDSWHRGKRNLTPRAKPGAAER